MHIWCILSTVLLEYCTTTSSSYEPYRDGTVPGTPGSTSVNCTPSTSTCTPEPGVACSMAFIDSIPELASNLSLMIRKRRLHNLIPCSVDGCAHFQ